MRTSVICVGRLKEDYYKKLSSEYEKRLSAYCKPVITEVNAYKTSENPSDKEIQTALLRESESISAVMPKNAYIIPLCIEGKTLGSEELSEKISGIILDKPEICFIIGGSHGLSNEIKEKADFKLSMSQMTFPHRLARIMLLEQIYRAITIQTGKKYHK